MARQQPRRAQGGYSLVELLLTVSLLLLFVGLGIVSISTMSQGSALNEGALRFETMLRFARAEAARSGHRVRVSFVQDTNQVTAVTNQLSHVEVTWEPDPASQPDVFKSLLTTQWGVDQVNETVAVESLCAVDSTAEVAVKKAEPAVQEDSADLADEGFEDAEVIGETEAVNGPAAITFNPDGSSDSVEVTLASRTSEDSRRVVVRVEGFTGTVSRKSSPVKDVAESGVPPKAASDMPL